ncbi:MAG: hypothetical protein KUG77_24670 [Nannocystaceae bacterium]|nr:hypothetical protein [Nannocystaceae bacterium]
MKTSRRLASLLVVVAAGLWAQEADAAVCDSLLLGNNAQDVIIGEAGYENCVGGPSPFCFFQPYLGAPRLGACWRDDGGAWQMEILECTGSSADSDIFFLQTTGGDDRVAVLEDAHTTGDLTLLPAGGGTGAMYCGSTGDAIAPWNPNFDFQLYAYLGTGSDLFHGSDNRDVVWTNAPQMSGGLWTSPADGPGYDKVCTWGGDDYLYGDLDDSWTTAEDWLDGGANTDLCDGEYNVDGGDVSDLYRNCETHYDAYPDAGLDLIRCDDDDDPLHEW